MLITFVCTGNACRSVMAEYLFRQMLANNGILGIKTDSCGIQAMPEFKVPEIVLKLIAEKGADASKHKPVRITEKHLQKADAVLVMEEVHRKRIFGLFPDYSDKVVLLSEYSGLGRKDIPDPIGLTDEVYLKTRNEIENCLEKLLVKLKGQI